MATWPKNRAVEYPSHLRIQDTDYSILSEDDVSINLSTHSDVAFPWIQFDVISALVRDWNCYTGIAEEFAVAESNYENVLKKSMYL